MELVERTEKDNQNVSEIIKGLGSDILVSRGTIHKAQDLDGILAYEKEKNVGIRLFYIKITVK